MSQHKQGQGMQPQFFTSISANIGWMIYNFSTFAWLSHRVHQFKEVLCCPQDCFRIEQKVWPFCKLGQYELQRVVLHRAILIRRKLQWQLIEMLFSFHWKVRQSPALPLLPGLDAAPEAGLHEAHDDACWSVLSLTVLILGAAVVLCKWKSRPYTYYSKVCSFCCRSFLKK